MRISQRLGHEWAGEMEVEGKFEKLGPWCQLGTVDASIMCRLLMDGTLVQSGRILGCLATV